MSHLFGPETTTKGSKSIKKENTDLTLTELTNIILATSDYLKYLFIERLMNRNCVSTIIHRVV